MSKRWFDLVGSTAGLLFLSPLLIALCILVKFSDGGPVFYRQERVGHRGRLFKIWKFRTMRVGAEKLGPSITRSADSRITVVGAFLRKLKLDELPQLFNVLVGEMSLVGPRPEVAKYVSIYSADQRRVLELIPGITDAASLEFRNEESLLAAASDMEKFYCEFCVPRKIRLNLEYAERASIWHDIATIVRTVFVIVVPSRARSCADQVVCSSGEDSARSRK